MLAFLRSSVFRWILVAAVVVVLAIMPLISNIYINTQLSMVAVWGVAILGLNILMGNTGQVSLGQIFFVGFGAYVTALGFRDGWPVILTFVLACVLPAVVGLVIALIAARMRGLALAMVTIALPIIAVPLAKRMEDLTGGSYGTSWVAQRFMQAPEWTGLANDQWRYYVVFLIAAVFLVFARNVTRGRTGRAFAIVKANESVAIAMGVSPYRTKVLAFTIASLYGGAAGFLYLVVQQYTSPERLHFIASIDLLAAMVIGGAASILGSIIGGLYYVLVPQLASEVWGAQYTSIVSGALLIIILFLLPRGLVSLPREIVRVYRRWARPKSRQAPERAETLGEVEERQGQR